MRTAVTTTARSRVAQSVTCEDYTCGHITRSPYRAVKRALFLFTAEREGLGSLVRSSEAPEAVAALALMRAGAECAAIIDAGTLTEGEVAALTTVTGDPSTLSPQVLAVMDLVTEGLSYPEIAAQVGSAVETVRSHVKRAMRVTGTHNAVEAAVTLVGEGLI